MRASVADGIAGRENARVNAQPMRRFWKSWIPAAILGLISIQASCNKTAASPEAIEQKTGSAPILDGMRCFEHVKTVVEFGPRPSGSNELKKTREYIISKLKEYGHAPEEDRFSAKTHRGPIEMINVRAEIEGDSKNVCLLMTHFDTKRVFNAKFLGANDGGSGVGVLLEIARYYSPEFKRKPPMSLRILFVDGEETQNNANINEAQHDWNIDDALWGSRHEVDRVRKNPKDFERLKVVILLDMIGDKNLNIEEETMFSTPRTIGWIRESAKELDFSKNFFSISSETVDDHKPFREAGVPDVVDLIDFDYGPNNQYWHTAADTIDKISPQSLRIVGDVVIRALPLAAKQWP